MEQLHPVLPTKEQLTQWEEDWHNEREHADVLLIRAFQAGADAELEACCKWIDTPAEFEDCRPGKESEQLRAARRPKPLSDKQRGLAALSKIMGSQKGQFDGNPFFTLKEILEALPD